MWHSYGFKQPLFEYGYGMRIRKPVVVVVVVVVVAAAAAAATAAGLAGCLGFTLIRANSH